MIPPTSVKLQPSIAQSNGAHLVLVHAECVLCLVEDAIAGAAVDFGVLLTAKLVANGLGGGLVRVGL